MGTDGAGPIAALQTIGLTRSQAAAYLTLVERGTMAARDVSKHCDVGTTRIYDVLRALERDGYVELLDQDTLHARAVDPESVLDELAETSSLLEDAADTIEDQWEAPDTPEHAVNVVRHAESVFEQAREGIREADTVVSVAGRPDHLERLVPALEAAVDDGVAVKMVTDPSEGPDDVEASLPVEDVATELRVSEVAVPFLVVVDHQRTYFTSAYRAWGEFGVFFDNYLISFVFLWFLTCCYWQHARPYYRAKAAATRYTSVREFLFETTGPLGDGATVGVTVEGIDTDTDERRTVSGTVVDVDYPVTTVPPRETPQLSQMAAFASLTVDTGDETVTVGGWGAVREDVEARSIRLDSLSL